MTEFFKINIGLQQGSVISPLLFCFYINELDISFQQGQLSVVYVGILRLFYLLYADDLALFSSTQIGLQRLLNKLSEYCKKWRLKVNFNKTKIIVFRKGGRLKKSEKWFLEGEQIETVSKFTYLGIVFSCSGKWYQAQNMLYTVSTSEILQ